LVAFLSGTTMVVEGALDTAGGTGAAGETVCSGFLDFRRPGQRNSS